MIGKISPIKKQYDTHGGQFKSIGTSLSEYGYTRFPGTAKTLVPYKERNGAYRTGLDENALYIERMPKGEQDQERARVRALREDLERMTGLDLSPRSAYYADMFDKNKLQEERAKVVKLIEGDNIFNLDVVEDAITFAWLRVHPNIAPSYAAWQKGITSYRCPDIAQCQFFVNDETYEAKVAYEKNVLMDKAGHIWYSMSPERRYKVAKLLHLPVSPNSASEAVYNAGKDYITATNTGVETSMNVHNFIKIAEMADENIDVRFRIAEAFDFNVYRKGKGGVVYDIYTDERVADTEQELVEMFSSKKHQEQYLALIKKIETAKSVAI